jgi:hypothetical protein
MAEFLSTYAQAQADAKGAKTNGYPTASALQRTTKIARFVYTTKGTEALNDTIRLGPLPNGARIQVENCRLRYGGSGAINLSLTLQRVRAGSATSLSTALATTAAAVGALTAANATPPTDGMATDSYQLALTAFTSAAAGREIHIEIPYDCPLI